MAVVVMGAQAQETAAASPTRPWVRPWGSAASSRMQRSKRRAMRVWMWTPCRCAGTSSSSMKLLTRFMLEFCAQPSLQHCGTGLPKKLAWR